MAFLKFTNAETGVARVLNPRFVIYVEKDTETAGALIWWVSYADAGQPRSKWLLTQETYEEVEASFLAVRS